MSDNGDPEKVDIFKAPPPATNLAPDPGYSNIDGMICRKKGKVSIDFCASCIEFEPAVKDVVDGDQMEGMDGIDPRTGNSYATCKWFGEIVRVNPFYAEVRRLQEKRFGRF